nr:unnamed protein product [Callosobruchus chinensis]
MLRSMKELSALDLLKDQRLNIHFASAGCAKRLMHNLGDIDGPTRIAPNSANGSPQGPAGRPRLPSQRDVGHVNLAFDHAEG